VGEASARLRTWPRRQAPRLGHHFRSPASATSRRPARLSGFIPGGRGTRSFERDQSLDIDVSIGETTDDALALAEVRARNPRIFQWQDAHKNTSGHSIQAREQPFGLEKPRHAVAALADARVIE